jgi:hypothetical protein
MFNAGQQCCSSPEEYGYLRNNETASAGLRFLLGCTPDLSVRENLLWKLNGGESCSFKESLHSKVRNSLLFRC